MPIANGITLPNSLSNGTTADAVPVMANYNALLNALNRALLDGGGTAGMNAQSTVIHNLSPGVAGTDAINLNQLNNSVAGYLPLTGGSLTGPGNLSVAGTLGVTGAATVAAITASGLITGNAGFSGTTLSLSSTLSVTGASTVAALTASGLITGNAGLSGTTLNLSGTATIGGNANTTGTGSFGGPVSVSAPTLGSVALTLTGSGTAGGGAPQLVISDPNNTAGASIKLTGNGATTPSKYFRAFSGAFQIVNNGNSAIIFSLDDSGNLTSIAAITASGLITGNAGFSGTTLNLSGNATIGGALSTTGGYLPNVQTVASSATVTPTFANDIVTVTAQAVALNLANPTGTATEGAGIIVRIKDNGTARAITYGTQYVGIGLGLPATTVAGKVLVLGMIYNANLTRWEVVSQAQE